MFLQRQLVIPHDPGCFRVDDPRALGTELRHPVIGELGGYEGTVAVGELVQLLKGVRLWIGWRCRWWRSREG